MAEERDQYIVEYKAEDHGLQKSVDDLRASFGALEAAVDEVRKAQAAAREEEEKATEATDKDEKAKSKLAQTVEKGLTQALKGATVAIGATIGALTAAAAATVALSKAGTAQSKVDEQLMASIRGTGLEAGKARKEWDRLNGIIGIATQTMGAVWGDEALLEGMSVYVRMTGDATAGTAELDRIMKIAASTGVEIKDAAKMAAEARQGEGSALRELTGLTKEQIAAIQGIKDPTERAAATHKALDAALAGVNVRSTTAQTALARMANVSGDLSQEIGKTINAAGGFTIVIDTLAEAMEQATAWVNRNNVEIQKFSLTVSRYAVISIASLATMVVEVIRTLREWSQAWQVVQIATQGSTLEILKAIGDLAAKANALLADVVDDLTSVADAGLKSARALASAFGRDQLVKDIDEASAAIKGMGDGIKDRAQQQVQDLRAYEEERRAQLKLLLSAYKADADATQAWADASLKVIDDYAGKAYAKLDKASLQVVGDLGPSAAGPAGPGLRPQDAAPGTPSAPDTLALDREILRLQREIMEAREAGDAVLRGELESRKILAEAQRDALSIKDEELRRETELIAAMEARQAAEAGIQEQVRAWADEATARHDKRIAEERAAAQAAIKAAQDRARAQAAAYQAETAARRQAYQAAGGLADLVIKDQRAISIVKGSMEAAEAVAQGAAFVASGGTNAAAFAASIQHGLASAKFFAVAGASSGGGGGASASVGGSGGAAGGGAGASTPAPVDLAQERRELQQVLTSALAEANSARASSSAVVNLYNPTFLSDQPEMQRQLTDAIAPEIRRVMQESRS